MSWTDKSCSRFHTYVSFHPYTFHGNTIADHTRACYNARNLGIIVENDLKMNTFVNNISRSASYALYRIRQIRKLLDKKSTDSLYLGLCL